MKTKNLFLVFLIMVTLGNCDLFAQTVDQTTTTQTAKPKRKYTKKVKPDANYSTQGMPTDNTASDAAKPKRKYTKKVKVENSAPVPTVQNTVSPSSPVAEVTKPKRTYTRRTPAVSNPAPGTTNYVTPTSYQAKKVAPQKKTYQPTSGGSDGKHQILVGPRGGRYYINKNGNKTYVK